MITKNGVADISFEIQTLIVNKIQIKNVHQPPGTTYIRQIGTVNNNILTKLLL